MLLFPTQPQIINKIWIYAWQLYKATFSKIWLWAFFVALINALPTVGQIVNGNDLAVNLTLQLAIILTASMLIITFFVSILMHRMYLLGRGIASSNQDSIHFVKHRLFTIFAGVIITTISILGGLLLFAIPGLILIVLFILWLPLILFDNVEAINALKMSCTLVWKRFWYVLTTLFIPSLLFIAGFLLINFFTNAIDLLTQTIINIIIFTFILPYFYAVILMIYHDSKLRKIITVKHSL